MQHYLNDLCKSEGVRDCLEWAAFLEIQNFAGHVGGSSAREQRKESAAVRPFGRIRDSTSRTPLTDANEYVPSIDYKELERQLRSSKVLNEPLYKF